MIARQGIRDRNAAAQVELCLLAVLILLEKSMQLAWQIYYLDVVLNLANHCDRQRSQWSDYIAVPA